MRILYLDIDSLSPSHMGCYGYLRNTTPTIDAIAAEGVRFTNVYCSDAPCMPSRTALYTGRLGIQTGAIGSVGTAGQPRVEGRTRSWQGIFEEQGLARQFQKLGMHTAMISPFGQRHGAHWIYAGFNEIHNTGKMGWESAEEVQPEVDDWLQRNSSKDNWYLHVNYWDPHTEYRVPMEFGNPFEGEPLDPWITPELIAEHMQRGGSHSALDLGMYDSFLNHVARSQGFPADSPEGHAAARRKHPRVPDSIVDLKTLRQWIDAYDTAIRYVDTQFAKIVAALKRAGVYEQTAIVISADHGENQGELGIYGEHATADQGTCNIPLIIKWPGGNAGMIDAALHYHLDLAPTYMDLAGGRKQPSWDGQSYAGVIKNGTGPVGGREQLVVGQCIHVCQRSVRFGPWLYIRTYHDGFYPFGPEMLFDIAADPHELRDLSAARADVCREGYRRLADWQGAQMRRLAEVGAVPPTDPMDTILAEGGPSIARHTPGNSPLTAYIARLRRTGRAAAADSLCRRYPCALSRGPWRAYRSTCMTDTLSPAVGLRTMDTPANVSRLNHFFQIEKALMFAHAAKLPDIENWAVKQRIGYHLREDMEHADALRRRRQELPGGRSESATENTGIARVIAACLHLPGDIVFCSAMYLAFKPMLIAAYQAHLEQTTSALDHPSRQIIERIVAEHERQSAWMAGAISMMQVPSEKRVEAEEIVAKVQQWIFAAGGILGEAPKSPEQLPEVSAYEMVKDPRREPRQRATFDFTMPKFSEKIDAEVVKLFAAFFREMAAAESVAGILYDAPRNMPWEFFVDTARHCWDEIRHCQAGEQRLAALGMDIWSVPVQTGAYRIRARMNVLERYAVLTQVQEKGAFGWKHSSERHFRATGDKVSADMVAYDIADETAHVKYGVKWLPRLQEALGDSRPFDQLVADSQAVCDAVSHALSAESSEAIVIGPGY